MKTLFTQLGLLFATIFLSLETTTVFAQTWAGVKFVYTDSTVDESPRTIPLIFERDLSFADSVEYDVLFIPDSSSATIGQDFLVQNQFRKAYHGVSYDTLTELKVLQDMRVEDTERVYILIRPIDFSNGYTDTVYILTILPSDTLTCSFQGAGYSYVEDTNLVQVKVILTDTSSDTTVVRISLDAGNAQIANDYQFTNNQLLTWLPGNNDTLSVWVEIFEDTVHEMNEQINFNLTKLKGSPVMDVVAYTIFIIDNDSAETGIATTTNWQASAFPNPVFSTLRIQSELPVTEVHVFNLLSQPVLQQPVMNDREVTVSLEGLPPGSYVLQLKSHELSSFLKVVKAAR